MNKKKALLLAGSTAALALLLSACSAKNADSDGAADASARGDGPG